MDNVTDLQILHNAHLSIYGTASINSDTAKYLNLKSIGVHNSGKLSQVARSFETLSFDIKSDMHVYAGAIVNVSSLAVNATDISVDVAGLVTASGRGFTNGQGPGHGYDSLHGNASGAGHGGTGGTGKGRDFAGRTYGSFLEPLDYGSGGGYGYKRQVFFWDFIFLLENTTLDVQTSILYAVLYRLFLCIPIFNYLQLCCTFSLTCDEWENFVLSKIVLSYSLNTY